MSNSVSINFMAIGKDSQLRKAGMAG